jgi:8-oxo-dGTP diphosphatase
MPTTAVVIINKERKLLLQLRDDFPHILYPNHWSLFGGHSEGDETILECAKREIKEELEYELKEARELGKIRTEWGDHFIFLTCDLEFDIENIKVNEGQGAKLFSEKEIDKIENLAPYTKESITLGLKVLKNSDK